MRTTVTIETELIQELLKTSSAKNKTAAVIEAVREQIRRARLRKLAGLLGKIDVDESALAVGHQADVERSRRFSKAQENKHGR